jgi:hypothetical protein
VSTQEESLFLIRWLVEFEVQEVKQPIIQNGRNIFHEKYCFNNWNICTMLRWHRTGILQHDEEDKEIMVAELGRVGAKSGGAHHPRQHHQHQEATPCSIAGPAKIWDVTSLYEFSYWAQNLFSPISTTSVLIYLSLINHIKASKRKIKRTDGVVEMHRCFCTYVHSYRFDYTYATILLWAEPKSSWGWCRTKEMQPLSWALAHARGPFLLGTR